jgi:hypothetical protein
LIITPEWIAERQYVVYKEKPGNRLPEIVALYATPLEAIAEAMRLNDQAGYEQMWYVASRQEYFDMCGLIPPEDVL